MPVKKKARKKRIGALPVAFSGAIHGAKFKVIHQFDIYGNVNSIIEDSDNGNEVVNIDGAIKNITSQSDKFYKWVLSNQNDPRDLPKSFIPEQVKRKITKFVTSLSKEVRDYNKGLKTKINVPKLTAPDKLPVKKKAVKKPAAKKERKKRNPEGYQYGLTSKKYDERIQAKPPGKRISKFTGKPYYEYRANRSDKGRLLGIHKDQKSHNVNIKVISGFFDTSVINTLDELKKEYLKLAKKYHPDAGGTTIQFQELQNEYEKLLKKIINGSNLNEEQKKNEFELDENIRRVVDQLVNLQNINIELIGKWLWISGDTYPVKEVFKSLKMFPVTKGGVFYWVYKGAESAGRGKMEMEAIKQKYGVTKLQPQKQARITGVIKINKLKLKAALRKVLASLNKRPV